MESVKENSLMNKGMKYIFASSALALALAGCSSTSTAAASAAAAATAAASTAAAASAAAADSSADYSNQTLMGKVTAVDGTTVTLSLGGAPAGDGTQAGDDTQAAPSDAPSGGQPGQKPDSTTGATPSQSADSTTGATSSGAPEQGEAPSGQAGGPGAEAGGTAVIDLTGATVTSTSGASVTLSDIAVDDMLQITVGASNNVTSVVIQDSAQTN
jgi:hypothetical protein